MQLAKPPVTLSTQGGYQVSNPSGTDELVIQKNNVEVLRIKLGMNMTIKTTGSLSIEAQSITLKADTSVRITSGSNTDINSQSQMSLKSASKMSVTASTFDVNGGALEVS